MIEILAFIAGIALVLYCSPKVVTASSNLARTLGVAPIFIAIAILSIGTSLPEISNSIFSSIAGHGDINVADTISSCIAQITLVFGLCVFLSGKILKGRRKDLILLGGWLIVATIMGVSIIDKGEISRIDGFFLVISFFVLLFIVRKRAKKYLIPKDIDHAFKSKKKLYKKNFIINFAGVIIGSFVIVNSIIVISSKSGIPEFILTFLFWGFCTSLPEFIICLAALRRKEYQIVVGTLFGSNITELTLSLGLGPIIRPNILTKALVTSTGSYLVLITFLVVILFILREKIDKKTSLLFIALYFFSYYVLFASG